MQSHIVLSGLIAVATSVLHTNSVYASEPVLWNFSGAGGTQVLVYDRASNGHGEVLVYDEASPTPYLTLQSPNRFDLFGVTRSSAGDIDGDGHDDILVGAPLTGRGDRDNSGAVYAFSGATGQELLRLSGYGNADYFGRAVAGAGDVDQDGIPDILSSGWYRSEQGTPYGRVYILSGATGKRLGSITSFEEGDGFGYTIVSLGDLTGDGVPEIAISAPLANTEAAGDGVVYIFDTTLVPLHHITTAEALSIITNSAPEVDYFGSILSYDDQQSDQDMDVLLVGSIDPSTYTNDIAQFAYSHHEIGFDTTTGTQKVPSKIPGDAIPDGQVSEVDLIAVIDALNLSGTPSADLDGDGEITANDVAIVVGNIGGTSPVNNLLEDPSPILSRMAELTRSGGGLTVNPIDNIQPWPGQDCDDDGDDDDGGSDDDDDGGPGIQPIDPGVRPRPGSGGPGDLRFGPTEPPDGCEDPNDPNCNDFGCVDDPPDDGGGEGCDSCEPGDAGDCNAIADKDFPRYVGKGMKPEVSVRLTSDEWVVTLSAQGNDADAIDISNGGGVEPIDNTQTQPIWQVHLMPDYVGPIKLRWIAFNTNTQVVVTDCFQFEVVDYKPLPFMHAAYIPCEVIDGPPFPLSFFATDYYRGDNRVFCPFQISLPEPYATTTNPGYRAKYELEIPCIGPVINTIPDCVPIASAGEYQTGSYQSIHQPTFGLSEGYNDQVPPKVVPTACPTLPWVTLACLYDRVPGAVSDVTPETQTASFIWETCVADGVNPIGTTLWPMHGIAGPGTTNHGLVFRIQPNRVIFRHTLSGKLPLFLAAPPIDMKTVAELEWLVHEDTGAQRVICVIDLDHDAYPAHEMYIGPSDIGNSSILYFDPLPRGNTAMDLLPDGGMTRRIRRTYIFD